MAKGPLVECKLCGQMLGSLYVHLKKVHNVYKATYLEQFPGAPMGHTINPQANLSGLKKEVPSPPTPKALSKAAQKRADETGYNEAEEKYAAERFTTLEREAGYDPTVVFVIQQIVNTEILSRRYQAALAKETLSSSALATSERKLDSLIKANDTLNKTHMALMDKMNLSREKRQQQKKAVETTPSRLISAYEDELRRMSPAERRVEREDEADAVRRFQKNLTTLLTTIPRSASGEEEVEDDLPEPD